MLFSDKKLDPHAYNPLALAYIGDTVYDLFIRTKVLEQGNGGFLCERAFAVREHPRN